MDYVDVNDHGEQASSSSCSPLTSECVICAQSAHGIHFGVSTCRACAAFFRRTVVLDRKYKCRRFKSNCDVTIDVRYLCRYCRYEKCLRVGMTPDNVQWDRDRMSSSFPKKRRERSKKNKGDSVERDQDIIEERENTTNRRENRDANHHSLRSKEKEQSNVQGNEQNKEQETSQPRPPPPQQIANLLSDFLNMEKRIETIFIPTQAIEVISPFHLTALQRMVIATERCRGQLPRNPPVCESIDFTLMNHDWILWLEKTAYWLMHCEEFARLDIDQKFHIFRSTWSSFLRLEKMAISLLMSGQQVVNQKLMACGDLMVGPKTRVHMGDLSNWSADHFKNIIEPHLDHLLEDLALPMLSIGPEPIEFVYILCLTVWNIDGRGVSKGIISVADKYRERISNELHEYYIYSKNLPNYAHRLIQLHDIIRKNERLQQVRQDMWTMFRVFDGFNFEFPDVRVFDRERM